MAVFSSFDGLLWFLLTLALLLALQRFLHREIQAVVYLASGANARLTMAIFSLLFLPGVLLHEFSHFLAAKLLAVPTRRFSVLPKMMPEGHLRMGYVEVAETDIVRDSLIGAAPLVLGNLVVAYIAIQRLHLVPLWEVLRHGQWSLFWLGVSLLPKVKDFPLWFYLTFAISSTMLPSPSDRHAWLPLGLSLLALLSLALFAGAGPWMMAHLAPPLNDFLQSAAILFGLSALVHGLLALPIALVHKLLARWVGWNVR